MNRRSFNSAVLGGLAGAMLQPTFAMQPTVPPEFAALGVQEDGVWVSPQFGVRIEWEQPFELDYTPGGSIFTNEYGDQFNIHLANSSSLYNASLSGPGNEYHIPFRDTEAEIRDFESTHKPEFLLFNATDEFVGALLVLKWGKSVLDGQDIPNQVYLLQSFPSSADPDIMINTRIDAGYDDIEEYVTALDQHVTVENGPALRAFELDEILEALKDLPPEGEG